MQGASVSIRGLAKSYGGTQVLSCIDLDIAAGEFVTLLGASGCGKSTLIRIIAGFEPQAAGTIDIGGRADRSPAPEASAASSMVFQSYALYPHMSVFVEHRHAARHAAACRCGSAFPLSSTCRRGAGR